MTWLLVSLARVHRDSGPVTGQRSAGTSAVTHGFRVRPPQYDATRTTHWSVRYARLYASQFQRAQLLSRS